MKLNVPVSSLGHSPLISGIIGAMGPTPPPPPAPALPEPAPDGLPPLPPAPLLPEPAPDGLPPLPDTAPAPPAAVPPLPATLPGEQRTELLSATARERSSTQVNASARFQVVV